MKQFPLRQGAFTIIELLMVIIVASILIALSYPAYNESILNVRRAQARAALHAVMLQEERYYTQHHTYGEFSSETENALFKWWTGDTIASSYYEISARSCPNKQLTQCVLLTATSGTKNVKNVGDTVCGSLMLDSANNKTYSNGEEPNASCW